MLRQRALSRRVVWTLAVILAASVSADVTARAESTEHTSMNVVVKDAETGQPINQAYLTLQFREPGSKKKLQRSKPLSYSAKTNPQGKYRFTSIPKGTIHLIVTAEHHQTFGKDFELEQDNQVIEVKLKAPQPEL